MARKHSQIPTVDDLRNQSPLIWTGLESLIRGNGQTLKGVLVEHKREIAIKDTQGIAHVYHLALRRNGQPMIAELSDALAYALLDYAIPRVRLRNANKMLVDHGDHSEYMRLALKAQELFVSQSTTGEGGELFLFALAEQVLGLPQILAKMSVKTSTSMHFHGSDGVHVGIAPDDGHLRLFFCESKVKSSVKAAIRECFLSAAPFLNTPATNTSDSGHELFLFADRGVPLEPELATQLLDALTPGTIEFQNTEICLVALVGFDAPVYPPDVEAALEAVREAVETEHAQWLATCARSIQNRGIKDFHIQVILIPFSCVQEFRDQFLKSVRAT